MILDHENMFSTGQKFTATAVSDQIVDLGPGDAGPSESLSLFVTADKAFTGTGTLGVQLLTSGGLNAANDALDAPVAVATYQVTNANLKAGGKLVAARLPHGMQRYAALNYVVDGTVSVGTVTAGLVLDAEAAQGLV